MSTTTKRSAIEHEAMKKRRRVLDLDLDLYLKAKSKILNFITLARQMKLELVQEDELDSIQRDLEYLKFRTGLNVRMDALNHRRLVGEYSDFDTIVNTRFMKMIDAKVQEGKTLKLRIENTEQLLRKRKQLNGIIEKYIRQAGVIKLPRKEIDQLFGTEIDTNVVIKGGRLVKESKEDSSLNEYEFQMTKGGSFSLSCQELNAKIEEKIGDCEKLRKKTSETRMKWQKLSEKVVRILELLENETADLVV